MKPLHVSDDIEKTARFLCLHMKKQAQDGENDKELISYRGSVAMYNNLNKAQKGFFEAIKDKKSVNIVWQEAAKLSLWLARIADLYEKEFDREEETKTAA